MRVLNGRGVLTKGGLLTLPHGTGGTLIFAFTYNGTPFTFGGASFTYGVT